MSKLQLALDDIYLDDALSLLRKLQNDIDIVEVGTPFLIRYGIWAVEEIRKDFPGLCILCDGKIMDAGAYEAEEMFQAGANIITVLALTDDSTIQACVEVAEKYQGEVMADMICVQNLPNRARELEGLGVHMIAVHTGVDQQARGRTPLGDLEELKGAVTSAKLAVAGGINEDSVDDYMRFSPDIVIVGGGILNQKDRLKAARSIHKKVQGGIRE